MADEDNFSDTELDVQPSDNGIQAANESRSGMEPRRQMISDISGASFTGHFAPSPIGMKNSGFVKSSDNSDDASSVGSTVKAERNEKNLTSGQMESFADIIAQAFVRANKESKYDSGPPKMPPLGVTGVTLSSGLDVLHVPRSGTQQATAGITSKYNCGDSESS